MINPIYVTSKLNEMEKTVNTIFSGVMRFNFGLVKEKAAEIASRKIKSNPAYDKPIGVFATSIIEPNAKAKPYSTASIASLWKTEKYEAVLKQHWESADVFLFELSVAAKQYHKECNKSNIAQSESHSTATKAIVDTRERKVKEFQLYSNWNSIDENVTDPDREFLYNHLRKDSSSNLYWVFDTGEIVLIPIQDAVHGRRIADDGDFWTMFIHDNAKKIKEFSRTIIEKAYELQTEGTFDSEEKVDSLEQRIENLVPHCISRQLSIQLTFVKEGSGKDSKWLFDSFSLAMAGQKPSLNRDNWCSVLQQDMLRFLDMHQIQSINQWKTLSIKDSDSGSSIYSFDASFVERGRKVTELPKLPPNFSSFFRGKLVNPIMCLLRIAVFVVSCIEDRDHSRQALLVVGLGKDGKGVWSKFLEHLFGTAFVTLQENAVDVNNKFGLMPALNKRVICMQDVRYPTQVIESPMFKSVTGCDTVMIDRKFLDQVSWNVDGTKMMIVTNKPVWLNNEYAITRILPVFFKQNYDPMDVLDVTDITSDLCAEANEFVQWAYDYIEYFKQLKNEKDEPWRFLTKNGLMILSDEHYKKWKRGELEKTHDGFWKEVQKEAFEAESLPTLNQTMFRVSQFESANESTEEFYQLIFDKMFILDPEKKTKRTDVIIAITTKAESLNNPIPELNVLGIGRSNNNERGRQIENLINWIASRPGIEKVRPQGTVYFKGLALRENTSFDLNTIYHQKKEDAEDDILMG